MTVSVDDRAAALAAVLIAETILADPSHEAIDDVVAALEGAHYDLMSAERLTLLVPLAFGRVLLKATGVEHFAWTVRIETGDAAVLRYALEEDPIFLEALALAVRRALAGRADEATFDRVARNSPEVDAARKAAAAGVDVTQARVHETLWRSQASKLDWHAQGAIAQRN